MKHNLLSLFAFTTLSLFCNLSYAESIPDKTLLKELEQYSNKHIECSDFSCNSINQAKVDLLDKYIIFSFNVSSRKSSFIELPFKQEDVQIHSVLLNNKPWYQIINSDSKFNVGVPQGEHVVSVKIRMNSNIISLTKKIPNILISSGISINERNGTSVISINEKQTTVESIGETKTPSNVDKSVYPIDSFYQVSRTLKLDNSWKIITTIKPLFETTKSITLEIPLLNGEKILTPDINIENNHAIINLSNQIVSWESTLSSVNQLEIPSVQTNLYSQVFSLESSSLWKYSIKGKNPFSVEGDITSWALWNGEKLNIEFKSPVVLEGKVLSLDNLTVSYHKEHDTNFYNYSLNANTSLAGKTFFTLPDNYKIEKLNINNQTVNIDKNTKKIPIDLNFGNNSISFTISTDTNQNVFKTFPYVQFPENIYNVNYSLTSQDWVFYSGGSNIHTEYILFSSLVFLFIISFITKKINSQLNFLVILFVLFGFLQNSIQIMLLFPILLFLIKFKDLIIQRFEKNKLPLEYNFYQFLLIFFSLAFIFSFLVTLKLGLLDSPSSWILHGGNTIQWFNELYSEKSIWYLEIDSTIYHVFMFVWAIFVSYHLINISKLAFKSIFSFELWIKKQPIITSNEEQS